MNFFLPGDLIIAGTDTVSVTLSWNIAILCRHSDVQIKVAAELDEFIAKHGRLPHFKERSHLPYCISVMKECMRYRPITPFGLPHTTNEDRKYIKLFFLYIKFTNNTILF